MSEKVLCITVPAYNMEAYLEGCLSSIVAARCADKLEVLVVDDGGTDASLAIAERFAREHPGVVIPVHKDNGGHGSVVNHGIEHATARYFKVIDGDDWVDADALDSLVRTLETMDADIVLSDYAIVEDGTDRVLEHRAAATDPSHYGTVQPVSVLRTESVAKIHSLTVRTALLQEGQVCVDEGCFYEDAELSIYPLAHARTVLFTADEVYRYRIGRAGQSVDAKRLARNADMHMRVMMSLLAFRDARADLDADTLDAIDRAIAYYTQNQYQIFLSIGNTPENAQALRAFDTLLEEDYPGVYAHATKRSIWLIRRTRYRAFPLGCLAYRAYRALR